MVLSFPGENVKCRRVCLPHLKQEQLEEWIWIRPEERIQIQLDLDLYMWKFDQNLFEKNLTKWRRTCQLEDFHLPIASQCAHQEAKHGKLFPVSRAQNSVSKIFNPPIFADHLA